MPFKKSILTISFSFCLLGCSVLCPHVPFPVLSKKYHDILGLKIETLTPMTLEKNINKFGDNYFFINYFHANYGQKIADIPVGTILIIDHMNRKYHIEYGTTDELIVRLNIPGYSGNAVLPYKAIMGARIWFYNEASLQLLNENEDSQVKNINLTELLGIKDTDQIIISTEKFTVSHAPQINKEITDKEEINAILGSINNLPEVPVSDTLPQYKLSFYKNAGKVADLSFFIDETWEWYFLRLNSPEGQRDFEPSKEFIEIFKTIK